MTLHLRAAGRHLPYGITQCYLIPDTSERAPPNPRHAGWYSIYLPQRHGRLSWPSWLDSAPAGSRTSDLLITSPTQNRYTTKTILLQLNTAASYKLRKQNKCTLLNRSERSREPLCSMCCSSRIIKEIKLIKQRSSPCKNIFLLQTDTLEKIFLLLHCQVQCF